MSQTRTSYSRTVNPPAMRRGSGWSCDDVGDDDVGGDGVGGDGVGGDDVGDDDVGDGPAGAGGVTGAAGGPSSAIARNLRPAAARRPD
jgi:hypothetical protein